MKSIEKGDKLVCIDDNFPAWARATYSVLPVKDSIYTVRHLEQGLIPTNFIKIGSEEDLRIRQERGHLPGKSPLNATGEFTIAILLEELHNPIHEDSKLELAFSLSRFRPLEEVSEQEKISTVVKAPVKRNFVKPKKKELVEV